MPHGRMIVPRGMGQLNDINQNPAWWYPQNPFVEPGAVAMASRVVKAYKTGKKLFDFYSQDKKSLKRKKSIKPRSRKKHKSNRSMAVKRTARGGVKRRVKRRKGRGKRRKVPLSKRIGRLERYGVKQSVKQVRNREYGSLQVEEDECAYATEHGLGHALIDTYSDNLKSWGTTAGEDMNVTDPGLQSTLKIGNWFHRIRITNSGHLPVKVRVYFMKSKTNTSINPTNAIINSDSQEGLGTTGLTNILAHPHDFDQLRALWKTIKSCPEVILNGGDTITCINTMKHFFHNAERVDQLGGPVYMKGSTVFLIRLEGVLARSIDTSTNAGTGDGGIIWSQDRYFDIKYPSNGVVFRYLETDNNPDALTGGATVPGANVDDLLDTA